MLVTSFVIIGLDPITQESLRENDVCTFRPLPKVFRLKVSRFLYVYFYVILQNQSTFGFRGNDNTLFIT